MMRHCLGRLLLPAALGALTVAGCMQDNPVSTDSHRGGSLSPAQAPVNLVTVDHGSESLDLWPYTGATLEEVPSDPVNLVFVGKADAPAIRAALMALDGDRTAFGFPDAFPFNATWGEAIGDVQAAYAGGAWTGSVIQLQFGSYESIRGHLRLFSTGASHGEDGVWTLGAAHFEVLIPGTADHQVISWGLPRDLVVVDLIRTGLLGEAPAPTGVIYDTPSFREIPAVIYNGLPDELKAAIGGPIGPVTGPVGILSDGVAMVLSLAGEAPLVPGEREDRVELTYQQIVPRPFCSTGPFDWVLVEGPIGFVRTTTISEDGLYEYQSSYRGRLNITPMDVTQNPPVPVGEPFSAVVNGTQNGALEGAMFHVQTMDRRIAPQEGGTEILRVRLRIGSSGANQSKSDSRCLE